MDPRGCDSCSYFNRVPTIAPHMSIACFKLPGRRHPNSHAFRTAHGLSSSVAHYDIQDSSCNQPCLGPEPFQIHQASALSLISSSFGLRIGKSRGLEVPIHFPRPALLDAINDFSERHIYGLQLSLSPVQHTHTIKMLTSLTVRSGIRTCIDLSFFR